ncbi:MarR family transcriptional regulator [Streptomyces sp. CA-210063]|uniref:MarR family winged helix-turn-helix transcriptional regulator n=1 Tax=Streptomyces sp. CA-210063 TaxID=2801029 RepID=UPI00214BDA94|nr:MarR family transcriptional regulator [Streptomyces sp. CA-210063]UUU28991.1 MarR family transcriptional regulator [Streptomyces sp. CA-210063]
MIRNNEEPVGLDALDRVTWALRRAELAVQTLKEQRLRPLGLAASHYTLLISVHAEPGLTGAELARRLNVTPQAVASLVARLESRGQLERREHPRHRHVQELHLTDAGREALRAADKVISDIEVQITDGLGAEEGAQLRALLDRVAETVREDRPSGPAG